MRLYVHEKGRHTLGNSFQFHELVTEIEKMSLLKFELNKTKFSASLGKI